VQVHFVTEIVLMAFVVSVVATPIARGIGRRLGILDLPNERSSHSIPTPRNGGYAILLGMAVALAMISPELTVGSWWLLGGAAIIALMGAVDDHRNLREWQKFVIQCAAAGVMIFAAGLLVGHLRLGSGWMGLGVIAPVFTLVWIVGYTNAFNFMDGINGIASTHAIVGAGALALLSIEAGDSSGAMIAAAIAGAAAGFLPWNMPQGSIFMGDVGSATLGFLLASLVVRYVAISDASFIRAMLPLMPFVLDTSVTLVRRIVRRERFFSAHRSHFYQRLNQLGWSHASVTGLWTAMAIASVVPAVIWMELTDMGRVGAVASIVIVHAVVFLLIHTYESRCETRPT
jgi:UDP-N-acetylmuramyl pentapeptide phosphotransferase/UDP-N-acetylglucosamine-1-phosphate transferase